MVDAYWDDVAKKSAERLAKGKGPGAREVWFPDPEGCASRCQRCGRRRRRDGRCACGPKGR